MWLWGRGKGKQDAAAKTDKLASLAIAQSLLETEFKQRPAGKAGLCLRVHSGNKKDTTPHLTVADLEGIADRALGIGAVVSGTEFKATQDQFKFLWLICKNDDLADLLTAMSKVVTGLRGKGNTANLLIAMVQFRKEDESNVFWMYEFDRDRFYPFVPLEDPRRDNDLEMKMAAKLEKVIPTEPQLERWHALWGAPFEAV